MQPLHDHWFNINRRQMLRGASAGGLALLGQTALSQLLAADQPAAAPKKQGGGPPSLPHFPPKAKRVIYLYQEGAPSQLDTFDYKPGLKDLFDKDLPPTVRGSQRLTGMTSKQARLPIAPSIFPFAKYPNHEDGLWVSDQLKHTASVAGELCVVKSMTTEQINHSPGVTFMQTGHQLPPGGHRSGRGSLTAWAARTRTCRRLL